jgi:hypothetical protein
VDVSINYLPVHGKQGAVRVADDPAVDISEMPIPMDMMRPKGKLGCPGVVPFAYTLCHDGDEAVSGAVAACAYAWGLPSFAR